MILLKKLIFILLTAFLISSILSSCSIPNKIYLNNKKPNNFYYTNLASKNVKLISDIKISIIDMNYYKQIELDKESVTNITAFFNKLNKENFIECPKDLPQKPKYKLIISSKNEVYVINVYNDKYISVYPWDGAFPMDYIDMSSIPPSINLYELCKFIYSL